MSSQDTRTWEKEYKSNVELLLQQMGSKLRGTVSEDRYTGEGGRPVSQVGPVVARKREVRFAPSPVIETPLYSRWVEPQDYDWGDYLDTLDKVRRNITLEGAFARNGAMALGRAMDDEIIAAFHGSAKTGKDGTGTPETFDTSNFQVGVQVGGSSTDVGLNVEKLLTAREMLKAAHVDLDMEPVFIAISAKQEKDLLGITQVTSADFNKPVLRDGRLDSFLGFNFVHSERLLIAGGHRSCPVWVPSGMHFGIWGDTQTEIEKRGDRSFAWYVYVAGVFGATRTQQGKVVDILCQE